MNPGNTLFVRMSLASISLNENSLVKAVSSAR